MGLLSTFWRMNYIQLAPMKGESVFCPNCAIKRTGAFGNNRKGLNFHTNRPFPKEPIMKTHLLSVIASAALVLGIIGCAPLVVGTTTTQTIKNSGLAAQSTAVATATGSNTPIGENTTIPPTLTTGAFADSITPSGAAQRVVGPNPENVPQGYNPLTGLPVSNPATLDLPAVLISITNFPPSARPQAGLSFSPWVYEMYIAEGMTRYLAAFYGDLPQKNTNNAVGENQAASGQVGPVRSGRLPYIHVRDSFQNSCLVYAGATYQVREKLRGCASVFGNDSSDINSAMLDVTRMEKIAQQNKRPSDKFNYSGNLFSPTPATQGAPASLVNVFYSFFNQSQWQFDAASGKYLKFEDFADGSGKFRPATDRLNGEQLAYGNVIVLYAEHKTLEPYIIDINLGMGQKGRAVIFRDGQRFEAVWTTTNGAYEQSTGLRRPIRIVDAAGNPFALKPGQSWVHIVTQASEILDKGNGSWLVRFYAPAGAK